SAAFLAAARARGVRVVEGAAVEGFDLVGGRLRGVIVAGERHAAQAVLCAAGVGSPALLRRLGLRLPVQIVRSSVAATAPLPGQESGSGRSMTPVWSPKVSFR